MLSTASTADGASSRTALGHSNTEEEEKIFEASYDPVLAGRPPKLALLSSRVSSPCRCDGCSLALRACVPEVAVFLMPL